MTHDLQKEIIRLKQEKNIAILAHSYQSVDILEIADYTGDSFKLSTLGNRHPILQNNTVIGAGAKIIGRITIGHDARIGAGSVIIRDVPPYTTMVPAPARPVRYRNHKLPVLTVERLNSRMEEELRYIRNTEERLERKMRCLERKRRSVPCREPERLRH